MGVDRVSRGSAGAGSSEVSGTSGPAAARPSTAFEVGKAQATEAVAPAAGSSPLAGVREGTLDRAGYVRAHVEAATQHLAGLPADVLESVRSTLRNMCESHGTLVGLVDRAMSAQPQPSGDR
jgi:hypothetical protein